MMTQAHRQQALSRAYVRAIAAMAGMICSEPEDDYGIDLCLRTVRSRGHRRVDSGGQVDLQLKSTTQASLIQGEIVYDLEVKTYDDLREGGDNCPRLLVLLVLPEDEGRWVSQSGEELCLRHCAYWFSLEGAPLTTSKHTVRVRIPLGNVFSVETLRTVLAKLSNRSSP